MRRALPTGAQCVDICGYLTCVSLRAQELSDKFVETYRFGTGQLDHTV